MRDYALLRSHDPEVYAAVVNETNRQRNKIELIASENFVSETVMEANGTTLTNKYAEGYPSKRYYGGCGYHIHVPRLLPQADEEIQKCISKGRTLVVNAIKLRKPCHSERP